MCHSFYFIVIKHCIRHKDKYDIVCPCSLGTQSKVGETHPRASHPGLWYSVWVRMATLELHGLIRDSCLTFCYERSCGKIIWFQNNRISGISHCLLRYHSQVLTTSTARPIKQAPGLCCPPWKDRKSKKVWSSPCSEHLWSLACVLTTWEFTFDSSFQVKRSLESQDLEETTWPARFSLD